MANGEDRPIIVSGGDEMYTITLPPATDQGGGSFTVKAQPSVGPFKTIEFTNCETNEVAFSRPATGNWTITIK